MATPFYGIVPKIFLDKEVAHGKMRLMKKLTNRDLASAYEVSLTQIKRWAVIVLGRDPEADQSGGVRREYTIDDAFMIYLFGEILVRRFGIGLKEAKAHMDKIMPQLKAENLLPSNFDIEAPVKTMQLIPKELRVKAHYKTNHQDIKSQTPFININIFPFDNEYSIEWGIFSYVGDRDMNGKQNIVIDSIRKFFPGGHDWPFHWSGPQYVILYFAYLEGFMNKIRNK
jgi:hypothetical protein